MEEPVNEMELEEAGIATDSPVEEAATAATEQPVSCDGEALAAEEEDDAVAAEFIRIDGLPLEQILEALLLASDEPLSIDRIENALGDEAPPRPHIRAALKRLGSAFDVCSYELIETASGFRLQVGQPYARWVGRLREDRPPRYSRALLETLALIAYRQPITRGEVEDVRGVAVSTNIIRTLEEREWIRTVGHKDVPGKPALYATTRRFLDYFNLKSLSQLPTLAEIQDLDSAAALLEGGAQAPVAGDAHGEEAEAEPGVESTEPVADAPVAHIAAPEGDRVPEPLGDDGFEHLPTPDVTH